MALDLNFPVDVAPEDQGDFQQVLFRVRSDRGASRGEEHRAFQADDDPIPGALYGDDSLPGLLRELSGQIFS